MDRYPLNRSKLNPPSSPPPIQTPGYCMAACGLVASFLPQQLLHYTYVWTVSGSAFWAYPVGISGGKLIAYIWSNNVWQLVQIDLSVVDSIY